MPGFQKKYARTRLSKVFFPSQVLNLQEKILQQATTKQRTLWWLFFFSFKKQIFLCIALQVLFLTLSLLFPFVLKYYLNFFSNMTVPEAQAKLLAASAYFLLL